MDHSDLLLGDAESALQLGDQDEMHLMFKEINNIIGRIEELGSEISTSPGGLAMSWEDHKGFRDNYRSKTQTLKQTLKILDTPHRKLSGGSNYSQTSKISHLSQGFQGTGDAAPQNPSKPPQKDDILGLPNPPNVPVKNPVETGPKSSE